MRGAILLVLCMGQLILGYKKRPIPVSLKPLEPFLRACHTASEVRELIAQTGNLAQHLRKVEIPTKS